VQIKTAQPLWGNLFTIQLQVFSFHESVYVAFRIALCFIIGAGLSALAGWCGMTVATDGNVI
jgi:Na+/H+-translocating membrane pyrophosphatase